MSRSKHKFGTDLGTIFKAVRTGRTVKAYEQFWGALGASPELFAEVAEFVAGKLNHDAPRPTFKTDVDYAYPPTWGHWAADNRIVIAEAVSSEYPYPDPRNRKVALDIELFYFHGRAMREQVLEFLTKKGYRPINPLEALEMLNQHPEPIWDLLMKYKRRKRGSEPKGLMVLGGRPIGTVEGKALSIELVMSDHEKWNRYWFSVDTTSNDAFCYTPQYFVPAVKI